TLTQKRWSLSFGIQSLSFGTRSLSFGTRSLPFDKLRNRLSKRPSVSAGVPSTGSGTEMCVSE
ncbi:MAG: hypothetical protein LBS86_07200, partial [Treponema sp.]|nr:hypothetical protein [Treponema sp.]